MRLNNAQIENMFDSDNNDITSVRKFRDALLSSNLVADVFINDHKVFSAPARLAHDSDYLIACIDGRFALSPAVTAENILIKVHYMNGEDTLFQSYTGHLCFPVDDSFGYDADLYFKVLDAVPYNMKKLHVPESSLRKLDACNFIPINLDEQPGPNPVDPGPSVILPTGDHYTAELVDELCDVENGLFVFTVTPDEGYEITSVTDNEGNNIPITDDGYMLTDVTGEVEVSIEVSAILCTVTLPDSTNTFTISTEEDPAVPYGSSYTFTVSTAAPVNPSVTVNGEPFDGEHTVNEDSGTYIHTYVIASVTENIEVDIS